MIDLHISVNNKIATFQQRDGDIVCGNSDYQIKFTFDDEWSAYEKKVARFIWGGQFQDVEFTGDTCPVPILSGVTRCEVGVYAGELCTTTPASISCKPSILCQGVSPSVENDKYYANEARKYAEEAREAREGIESPYIKNGNWWIGDTDTGVKATGGDYILTEADKEEIAQKSLGYVEKAVAIDLSNFDTNGQIVETYPSGTKTTTVEFDEDGNPIKITDGDGNEITLTW